MAMAASARARRTSRSLIPLRAFFFENALNVRGSTVSTGKSLPRGGDGNGGGVEPSCMMSKPNGFEYEVDFVFVSGNCFVYEVDFVFVSGSGFVYETDFVFVSANGLIGSGFGDGGCTKTVLIEKVGNHCCLCLLSPVAFNSLAFLSSLIVARRSERRLPWTCGGPPSSVDRRDRAQQLSRTVAVAASSSVYHGTCCSVVLGSAVGGALLSTVSGARIDTRTRVIPPLVDRVDLHTVSHHLVPLSVARSVRNIRMR